MAEACLAETEAAARIAVAFGLNREGLSEAEVAGCNACEMACRYACCKASSDSPAAATDPDRLCAASARLPVDKAAEPSRSVPIWEVFPAAERPTITWQAPG